MEILGYFIVLIFGGIVGVFANKLYKSGGNDELRDNKRIDKELRKQREAIERERKRLDAERRDIESENRFIESESRAIIEEADRLISDGVLNSRDRELLEELKRRNKNGKDE